MVYLKEIFAATTIVLIFGIALQAVNLVESTKIAYKKPIYGKTQLYKEKQRLKPMTGDAKTTESFNPAVDDNIPNIEAATVAPETATTLSSIYTDSIEQPQIEANKEEVESTTDFGGLVMDSATSSIENTTAESRVEDIVEPVISGEAVIAAKPAATVVVKNSNLPVPCTCGVFLDSQFKRGSNKQPQGRPVILNELDNIFACNAIGQRQCQTKCLETMVQHLPNSANILCATLDRDCRKERAYLFVKNCRNSWVNTNLAAGREYCCKNGKSYQCPLI